MGGTIGSSPPFFLGAHHFASDPVLHGRSDQHLFLTTIETMEHYRYINEVLEEILELTVYLKKLFRFRFYIIRYTITVGLQISIS